MSNTQERSRVDRAPPRQHDNWGSMLERVRLQTDCIPAISQDSTAQKQGRRSSSPIYSSLDRMDSNKNRSSVCAHQWVDYSQAAMLGRERSIHCP
ncbi:unnamed protein product [Calypogeia fissa]